MPRKQFDAKKTVKKPTHIGMLFGEVRVSDISYPKGQKGRLC